MKLIKWTQSASYTQGSMVLLDLPHHVARPAWFEIKPNDSGGFTLRAWGAGGHLESNHGEEHEAIQAAEAYARQAKKKLAEAWLASVEEERQQAPAAMPKEDHAC